MADNKLDPQSQFRLPGDDTKYLDGTGQWSTPAGVGTVTSVSGGTGLTGTVTTSGSISLDSSSIASLALADTAVQNLGDLGITATSTEINVLDGITATTTELNYVDGVTSAIQTQLDAKVSLTGDQTIADVKTFSSFPVTPSSDPTTDYQVANKKYVDDNAGGSPGGSSTQVQYNKSGSFAGDSNFTYDDSTGKLSVPIATIGTGTGTATFSSWNGNNASWIVEPCANCNRSEPIIFKWWWYSISI